MSKDSQSEFFVLFLLEYFVSIFLLLEYSIKLFFKDRFTEIHGAFETKTYQ